MEVGDDEYHLCPGDYLLEGSVVGPIKFFFLNLSSGRQVHQSPGGGALHMLMGNWIQAVQVVESGRHGGVPLYPPQEKTCHPAARSVLG